MRQISSTVQIKLYSQIRNYNYHKNHCFRPTDEFFTQKLLLLSTRIQGAILTNNHQNKFRIFSEYKI